VTTEGLEELKSSSRADTMRVMIAGGGSVGVSIALDLVDRHHDVTLLEQVSTTAERLKAMLRALT